MNKLHDLIAKLDAVAEAEQRINKRLKDTETFKNVFAKQNRQFDLKEELNECHNEKVSLLKHIISESEEQLNQLK